MTTIIEHPEYGRVEGVNRADGESNQYPVAAWDKDGALYFVSKGWREVKPQAVDVTEQVRIVPCDDAPYRNRGVIDLPAGEWNLYLPPNHIWHKTQAVVLPEDWVTQFNIELGKRGRCISDGCRGDIQDVLHLWEQSVLLIKKEV